MVMCRLKIVIFLKFINVFNIMSKIYSNVRIMNISPKNTKTEIKLMACMDVMKICVTSCQ